MAGDDLRRPAPGPTCERGAHPGARVPRAEAQGAPLGAHARHEVGSEHRQRLGRGRQRLALREIGRERVDRAPLAEPVEQAIALREQELAVAARVHERRRVRQHGQRRGLGPRQLRGVAPEVAPGGGVEAHGVAAEGRVGGVEAEHLLLREREREAQREDGLHGLLGERAGPSLAGQAHHLHGERAAAAHDAAAAEVRDRRAAERERVDSRVPVEAAVLEAGDRGRELRRHRGCDAEAPLAVRRDRGAEQLAVAIEHDRRQRVVERHDRDEEPEREQHGRRETGQANRAVACRHGVQSSPLLLLSPGSTTSTHWPFARALIVASYIASTVIIGR